MLIYGWCICRFSQKVLYFFIVFLFDYSVFSIEALTCPLTRCTCTISPLESSICLSKVCTCPVLTRKHQEAHRLSADTNTIMLQSVPAHWNLMPTRTLYSHILLPLRSHYFLMLPIAAATLYQEDPVCHSKPCRNEGFNSPLRWVSIMTYTPRITPNVTHPCHHSKNDLPVWVCAYARLHARVCVCLQQQDIYPHSFQPTSSPQVMPLC